MMFNADGVTALCYTSLLQRGEQLHFFPVSLTVIYGSILF